jgi:hypothetical protein
MILPDLGICREPRLYVRCLRHARFSFAENNVQVLPGGRVSFATYYGALNAAKWAAFTGIRQWQLRLALSAGAGEVVLWNYRPGHAPEPLLARRVRADSDVVLDIPPSDSPLGIVAPEFIAHEAAVMTGGTWLTPEEPLRAVRLGIVITSFRREAAVRTTVKRLAGVFGGNAHFPVDILVIDNGRTLQPEDVPGARLLPNLNLGGSGGFARGLAELLDENRCTHAVFMDDDASTELESVKRAVRLLRYARDDRTAVVSGLLYEEHPGIQLEAAGIMPSDQWMPVNQGLDLRLLHNVIRNEQPFHIDYGGWWMFFFPLQHVRLLPFPFFVRGDDVEFPRSNPFELVTLNGINSFGPNFLRKESPVNIALDRRGGLVNVLLHGSLRQVRKGCLRGFAKGLMLANRYCYDHADALAEASRDVLRGPTSFEDLAGFVDGRRKAYAACARQQRLSPDEAERYPLFHVRHRPWAWHIMRMLLLNGHLLPRWLLLRKPAALGTVWESRGMEVFLRPRIVVFEGLDGHAVLAERSVARYFGSLARLLWITVRLIWAAPRLQREFREARPHFGSRAYWDRQFGAFKPQDPLSKPNGET